MLYVTPTVVERQVPPLITNLFGNGDNDGNHPAASSGGDDLLSSLLSTPTSSGRPNLTLPSLLPLPSSSSSFTSLSSSLSSSTSSSATAFSEPPVAISASAVEFESSSAGRIVTVTSFADAPTPTPSQQSAPPKTFLQNRPLSGAVFGLCGAAGLILIVMFATCAVRQRRRAKLLNEAISFDPRTMVGASGAYDDSRLERVDSTEKRPLSASSSGHGHTSGPSNQSSASNLTTYMPATHTPSIHQTTYSDYPDYAGYHTQGYGTHQGWYDQGQYTTFAPPRVRGDFYAHGPPTLPQLNFISATPPTSESRFDVSSLRETARDKRTSALGPHPSSSSYTNGMQRHTFRELGGARIPVAAPLPAVFGVSDDGSVKEDIMHGGRTLKVANE